MLKIGKSEESEDEITTEETSESEKSEISESESDQEDDELKVNITPKEAENLISRLAKPFTPTVVNKYEPTGYFKPKVVPFKVIVPPVVNTKTAIEKLPTGTKEVEKKVNKRDEKLPRGTKEAEKKVNKSFKI